MRRSRGCGFWRWSMSCFSAGPGNRKTRTNSSSHKRQSPTVPWRTGEGEAWPRCIGATPLRLSRVHRSHHGHGRTRTTLGAFKRALFRRERRARSKESAFLRRPSIGHDSNSTLRMVIAPSQLVQILNAHHEGLRVRQFPGRMLVERLQTLPLSQRLDEKRGPQAALSIYRSLAAEVPLSSSKFCVSHFIGLLLLQNHLHPCRREHKDPIARDGLL